jgi:serine protease 16
MDAVESLAALHRSQMQSYGMNSTDISHKTYEKELTADPNNMSWMWQTCAEFGFYQTCEVGSNCPFAKGYLPLDSFLNDCEHLFGIGPEEVQQNVNSSNEWYGGWDIQATRILSVNGDVDPWAQLARTPDHKHPTRAQPTIWVKGASHHFWTHATQDTDDIEIVKARDHIYQTVTRWLEENDEDPAIIMEMQEDSAMA